MVPYTKLNSSELLRLDIEKYKKADKLPFYILADNIRSAHNIGSLFRTADAFGCKQVILTGISATPPNKEILKTALGATESVEWSYSANPLETVRNYKQKNVTIIALEQTTNSILLKDFNPAGNKEHLFILGNEVEGVNQELLDLCDTVIEIPQLGTKHSLNVSVAGGILMWDIFTKLT